MLVRLRDFAEANRISERTVQLHIKNNQDELEGHIDRRGKQGTWLDDFAVNFLLDRIQLPTKDEVLIPTAREAALMSQISEISMRLAEAERRAGENAEAAGKVLLLEEARDAQKAEIGQLNIQVGQLTERAEEAAREAERAKKEIEILEGFIRDAKSEIKAMEEEKVLEAQKVRQEAERAQERLTAYAAEVAAFNALPWHKKIGKKAPVLQDGGAV